ncbi:MAG TPA: ATP-binding protein [Candidatus Paceibacterota bacterium]|nr:ATP-binding protein [Candidatus Paceibacterota bacterium]
MTLFGVRLFYPLSGRQWRAGILLLVAYVAATRLSAAAFAAPGLIFPASGFALGGLFLEGFALWPFVFVASLIGYVLSGASPVYLLFLPIAHTLQAVLGAYLLRTFKLDPLFRRSKDMFTLIGVALVASVVVPTIGTVARHLHYHLYNLPPSTVTWASWYAATVFSLLIISPFVIRWFAKPRFSRTFWQWIEVLVPFGFLATLSYFLFFTSSTSVVGISLAYFILIPLFWIALRLRPRFITLALLILSCFALSSLYVGPLAVEHAVLGMRLFQTEIFLNIVAIIFFILSSIEEERRMTTNLMKTQMESLSTALAKVAYQDKAKSEFMAMLAHELRNPLAPVVSSVDLLRLSEPAGSERAGILEVMDERLRAVRRLLDDLLDVTRINENKLSLQKEKIAIQNVVERAILSTKGHFAERTQTLSVNLPEDRLIVHVDPLRIEQAVTNLLTNASKFSEEGSAITLEVAQDHQWVTVRVTDTGVGIPSSMLASIFDPFLQIEQGERTRKGIGIGLSLVKSFVEMHDGSVEAVSGSQGSGSTFSIRLPLLRVERASGAPSPSVAATPASMTHCSVLVVDDNDAAAWGVGKLLELSGCTIEYAYDGEQAIQKALNTGPDAVLLDIDLPDHDGYHVAKELRAKGYTGAIIALSGYSLEQDRQRGRASGFTDYLVKPVGLADLRRVLPLK